MTMSRHCIAALSAQYHLHSSNEASDKLFLIGEIKNYEKRISQV